MAKKKRLSIAERFALAAKEIAKAQAQAYKIRQLQKKLDEQEEELKRLRAMETWVEDTHFLEDERLRHFKQVDYDTLFDAVNENDFYQRATEVAGKMNLHVREIYTLWLSP